MSRLFAVLLVLFPFAASAADSPEGKWQGAITIATIKLTMGLSVSRKPDGTLSATLASLDQGSPDMQADSVTWTAPKLTVEAPKMSVHLEGTIAGDQLTATLKQSGREFALPMKRVAAFATHARPQEPKRPLPYREEEVSITVPDGKSTVTLAGTLTIPTGTGPFPAVLFISGSGPEDRDETVFRHRPFLVVSDALTRAGIVTLRFDDRGTGKSGGTTLGMTMAEAAKDTLAELELLVHRPEVDRKRVGLIGHSEGGVIAPMVAAQSTLPRFLVLLAGVGVPGTQVIATQIESMMRGAKMPQATIDHTRQMNAKIWSVIMGEPDQEKLKGKLKELLAQDPAALAFLLAQLGKGLPTVQDLLAMDPKPYLQKVKVPVLALGGERDLQVDAKVNLAAIDKAVKSGGNRRVTVVELPGLNHLFQHASTGMPGEYLNIEETFAPEALGKIRDFVLSVR